MSTNRLVALGCGIYMGVALSAPVGAAPPPGPSQAAPAGGERLVPLEPAIPKPLSGSFLVSPWPTLEKAPPGLSPPIYVPQGTRNLALKMKVTSSDPLPVLGDLPKLVDGDKEQRDEAVLELAESKTGQWVQIDLGASASVYAVVVWHYYFPRAYRGVIVQVSDDPDFRTGVQTLFNNDRNGDCGRGRGKDGDYLEDHRGKRIDARNARGEPALGRYVRLYSNGFRDGSHTAGRNHYLEVEVYGKPR